MRQSLSATTGLIKLLFASVIGLTLVNILDAVTLSMESTKITGNIFILVMTTLSLVCIITETRNLNGISIIIFIVVAGYIVALDTETFINLYLALEVAAFGSYALIGANTNRLTSIEGAIKYFLGTSISSLSLILGISILYSSTGSTNIGLISQMFLINEDNTLIQLGILLIIIGLTSKLAVAPLHWFTIDAYQSAPTSISMFLMTVPKIALLTIIYRIFSQFNLGIISIIVILMILSTFLFLSIQALGQLKLKRFIIFTMTINNVIFLAPLLLNHSENSFSIFTLLLCYFLPFSLTFYCLSLLPKSQEKIENLFFIKNPVLILSFLVSAVSFSGIPVFAGFLVKYLVYSQLLSFHELTVLLPIVILSLLPIYYYIRLVQATFFTQVVEPSYSFIMPTFVPKESATQTTVLSSLVVLNLIIITIQIIPSFW